MASEYVVHGEKNTKSQFMAMMSYLGVLCLVPLVRNKDDEYVDFHARQGLVIWILGILAIFTLYIPGLGKLVFGTLAMMVMAYSILGLVSVLLHKAWRLPIIYNLSTKL